MLFHMCVGFDVPDGPMDNAQMSSDIRVSDAFGLRAPGHVTSVRLISTPSRPLMNRRMIRKHSYTIFYSMNEREKKEIERNVTGDILQLSLTRELELHCARGK